jgi:pyruvate formate lyase activating enzyme
VQWNIIKKVLPYTDLILIDVKGVNPVNHLENTSVTFDLIHENIERLKVLKDGPAIHVRIPLIRGLNDDPDQLPELIELLSNWPALERIELLPYHSLGAEKSIQLVSDYRQDTYRPPPEEVVREFEKALENAALPVMKSL